MTTTATPKTVRKHVKDIDGTELQIGDIVLYADNFHGMQHGCVLQLRERTGLCVLTTINQPSWNTKLVQQQNIKFQDHKYRGTNPALLAELFPHAAA